MAPSTCRFGDTPADFEVVSDTQITATSPPGPAGVVDVTVETYAGTSVVNSNAKFTYSNASAPTVTALSPTNGPTSGGTPVTITGTNFTGATKVEFDDIEVDFEVVSATQITVVSPRHPAGTVDAT